MSAGRASCGAAFLAILAVAPARAASGEPPPVELAAPPEVARLCRALQPAERAAPGVAAAQAREREKAIAERYRVTLSGDGLDFEAWSEEAGLGLSPRAVLGGVGGSLRLWIPDNGGLAVKAPRAAVRRIFDAKKRGRLALRLVFEIPRGEAGESPCSRVSGARVHVLAVEPVSWEYLAAGEVVAGGGAGADRTFASGTGGAQPRVDVGEAVGEAATPAVRSALQESLADLEACYREALERSPRLDGTLVVEVALGGKAGRPRSVRISVDSVQDEGLAACVKGVAARARFPAGRPGTASLPVHFELAAGSGTGEPKP